MGKLLAIDYGEKRVGIAVSDEEQHFAFERGIWPAEDFFKKITGFINEEQIEKIILGYPLTVSGQHSKKTDEVVQFKEKLQTAAGVPVELIDERFSSQVAAGMAGSSKNIDSLAALVILENYIQFKLNNQN